MAYTGNGSSGFFNTTTTLEGPSRFTFTFHYRNTAAPGIATFDNPLSISTATASYDVTFSWDHVSGAASFFMKQSSGSYIQLQVPAGILDANTWYVITCRYDGVNMAVFVDGVLRGSVAASNPPAAINATITALAGKAGTDSFDDGTICEVAVWTVALTDEQIYMLGRKFTPDQVRLADMVVYWPLIREVVAVVGTITSGGGLTVADHAPIIEGDGGTTLRLTNDATYVINNTTGGVTFEGESTIVPTWSFTTDGGVTFGGSSPVMIGVSFSTAMNFGGGLDQSHLRTTIQFAGNFDTPTHFGNWETGISFGSKFIADSGSLANGRLADRLD